MGSVAKLHRSCCANAFGALLTLVSVVVYFSGTAGAQAIDADDCTHLRPPTHASVVVFDATSSLSP
jgi:hypothetical protein